MFTAASWLSGFVLCALVTCGTVAMAQPPSPDKTSAVVLPAFPDIDALAARMKTNQDIYQKVRDEALAGYANRNTKPGPADEKAKTVIRLFALMWVWDDFYGEGLWQRGANLASVVQAQGANDPLIQEFLNIHDTIGFSSGSEDDALQMNRIADQFLAADVPVALKLWACEAALGNLVNYRENHHADSQAPSMQARAHFVEQWGQNYRALIKQRLPHDILYLAGDSLLQAAEDDESTLYLIVAEQERDFNEADPKNPVRTELDGDYFIKDAWNARGSDYANTVSDAGWKLFADRLAAADKILEPLYDLYPNETGICHAMMTVELGQGQGKDRLETWFQRAIKINPDDFRAYKNKEWYLLPRWYGSVDIIVAFGQQCVQTGNWTAKLPLIFTTGISESADGEPELYTRPEIWNPIEKVYRDYLARYPNAIFYRTSFAKHAYDGGHLDVAREQFNILLGDFDKSVLSNEEFMKINTALNSK